jgi:hypothetical protein
MLLTVTEFELLVLVGEQLVGCTTSVEGALVWCTEVGTLQLFGLITVVLGALFG